MRFFVWVGYIFLHLSVLGFSASSEQNQISEEGRKRLVYNLKILQENQNDTEQNLSTTHKNIETIESEIAELTKIDKQHTALIRRYQRLLAKLDRELEKNENLLSDYKKQRELHSTDKPLLNEADSKKSEDEKAEREQWKGDALNRKLNLSQRLGAIRGNQNTLALKRADLRNQLALWTAKSENYSKMLKEIQSRLEEAERLSQDYRP